jgi:competence protein ComFC
MIKDLILDLLFPKYCLGCGREGQYICDKCLIFATEIQNTGDLTCFWEYDGIIKKAIHKIKYNGVYDIARELVSKKDFVILSKAKNPKELRDPSSALGGTQDDNNGVVVTFVPMTKKREAKRGFNQAEIIAKEIGRKTGRPVVKLLEKIRETSDQIGLSRTERLENLKNSFRCLNFGFKQILLVDDVYTTGATMEECSRILRKAGASKIHKFAICKTV